MKSLREIELAEDAARVVRTFTTSGFVVRAVLTKRGTWFGCAFSATSGHIIFMPVTELLLGNSGLCSIMELRRWDPYERGGLTLRAGVVSGEEKMVFAKYGITP
jgi:hypothetical protein